MSFPEFAQYMNPLINTLKKLGGSARPDEVCNIISEDLKIPDDILERRLKNGVSRYENQVHWARYFLFQTGYIQSSARGVWGLTEKGQNTHELSDKEIQHILQEVRTKTFKTTSRRVKQEKGQEEIEEITEPEGFEKDYREKLIHILKTLPPTGFERLCQRLLREAGFEKVSVTQRTGDGGIDGYGVLQINPFVSFNVLFQCKRYDGSVSSPHVRDFRGAMQGRAEKGIILTTGSFTADAKREAVRDGVPPIELVDGDKLLDMFEELQLGLIPKTTYIIDPEFFNTFKEK